MTEEVVAQPKWFRKGAAGERHNWVKSGPGMVMHVPVNGVRLFFDVEGAKLVPDGTAMREKPTLMLLHGGPGFDHTIYKPAYSRLADVAQVIYLDHRGNGRSDAGPKESWNLRAVGRRRARLLRRARHREADRARRVVRRHGGDGLCDAPSGASGQAHPGEHRGERQLVSGAARRDCSRASAGRRSARSRTAASSSTRASRTRPRSPNGASARCRSTRATRATRAMGRAIIRQDVLQWFTRPDGGEGHRVRHDGGPEPHRVPDPGDRRRGRSDDADRGAGGHRGGAAAASRALRALSGVRPRHRGGRAGGVSRDDQGVRGGVISVPRLVPREGGERRAKDWMPAFAGMSRRKSTPLPPARRPPAPCGRLLADHDGGRVGVARGQRRHDRGVGDAQPCDAAHAQAVVDHGGGSLPMRQVPTGW